MTPVKLDLNIYKGSTYRKGFQWKVKSTNLPMDLTGCSIKMQIKTCPSDTSAILELSTTNGAISIADPATEGKWQIEILPEQTAGFDFSIAVYDMDVTFPSGDVFTLVCGKVIVKSEVTK